MSYRLAFAADSKAGWDKLSLTAQEWVLDQLERFAESLAPPGGVMRTSWRLAYESDDVRQTITIVIVVNATSRTMSITDVRAGRERRRR
jgi:mRNA-degrading endonuclease RelE of RelBE toxin-antitoxin system